MIFTVYSSFRNVSDFENGIAIQCFPERHSAHDIAVTFNSKDVSILANQTGLYIQKKTKKKLFDFKRKRNSN